MASTGDGDVSRSKRKPYDYYAGGDADGAYAKRMKSKKIRSKVKIETISGLSNIDDEDFDFMIDDQQDKNRGKAGSRSADWGWKYYNDGRRYVGDAENRDYLERVVRK